MNVTLKDGVYWLDKPTVVNLDEWAEQMNYPAILMVKTDNLDDFVTLVAYSSVEYSGNLGKIARNSNGKYCFMMTEYADGFCNPI